MTRFALPGFFAAFLALQLLFLSSGSLAQPLRVAVGVVESVVGQGQVTVSGELSALRTAVLSAEVAGAVEKIMAENGDSVERDAVLASIRERPAQLELRAARGRVAQAVADVERARINERRFARLLQRKALSQDEYDTARVELDKARASLETRRAEAEQFADNLSRHYLRAPFDGTVVARHIELGQWLDVGDPCYAIEDTTLLRAKLSVPQQYYGAVVEAAVVNIRYDALPGETQTAVVSRKLPLVRRAGRSFEVWLDVDNRAGRLVPGLSLQAAVALQQPSFGTLLVPRDAVVRGRDGGTWVWLVQGGEDASAVSRVDVSLGGAARGGFIVQSDRLAVGMRVVTHGNESLQEGQSVQISGA